MTKKRNIEVGMAGIDLTGHTVIVTGGARGIGGAVSRLFASQGADVVIADVLEAEGKALAAELGARAAFRRLDVSDENAWEDLVTETGGRLGSIDALINCAGILILDAVTSFDRERFEKVIQVNLIGTFLGIKHVGKAMVAAGNGGSIVNISSTEGLQGSNSMAAYASSKWAVRGLTKVAAMELGPSAIRVNSIHPGPVNTMMANPGGRTLKELDDLALLDFMPIRRVADPSEIAHACLYLAGSGSAFVTGAELAIDGGLTIGMLRTGGGWREQ